VNLFLSEAEMEQLERIGEKFSYAQLLWNITLPGGNPGQYTVDPADAWAWKDAVDQDKGFLPLAQGELKQKLVDFYERIA
jgi:hypothetical protein